MFRSLSEFKFFQSFRVPVESKDDIRFGVEKEGETGKLEYINDARLVDISSTGLGFTTTDKLSVSQYLRISIQFKKLRFDISGTIVRAFSRDPSEPGMTYGVEVDTEDHLHMRRWLEQYIHSFSPDRLRDCLVDVSLKEKYAKVEEGFEMFSLLLSLFKDITQFGNKEGFLDNMLEEVCRILDAQRATVFLINPETNELEAIAALGLQKGALKFDYRKGIAGSVFTTGVSLNIDTSEDQIRFSDEVDIQTGFKTRSIICTPISNREDKNIGVLQVLNKRNQTRFSSEDERTMKVISLIFSSIFHDYNPISDRSIIRRFSTPHDRDLVLIGKSQHCNEIRKAIVKLKDIDSSVLITGEAGTGKSLLAKIIHHEGKRSLASFETVSCQGKDYDDLSAEIFGSGSKPGKLETCVAGTLLFHEISFMPLKMQHHLMDIIQQRHIPDSKITLDLRLIFTSSKDLKAMSYETGEFNPELFEYMSSSLVNIEPLRKRPQDIEGLISYFLKKECKKQGFLLKVLSPEARDLFISYDWPGNIAELERAIERAVVYNPKAHVISDLGNGSTPIIENSHTHIINDVPYANDSSVLLKDRVTLIEQQIIEAEIKRAKGNKSKAAKNMGISREALRKKLLASEEVITRLSHSSDAEVIPLPANDKKKAA